MRSAQLGAAVQLTSGPASPDSASRTSQCHYHLAYLHLYFFSVSPLLAMIMYLSDKRYETDGTTLEVHDLSTRRPLSGGTRTSSRPSLEVHALDSARGGLGGFLASGLRAPAPGPRGPGGWPHFQPIRPRQFTPPRRRPSSASIRATPVIYRPPPKCLPAPSFRLFFLSPSLPNLPYHSCPILPTTQPLPLSQPARG